MAVASIMSWRWISGSDLEECGGDLGRVVDLVLERPQQRPQLGRGRVERVADVAGGGVGLLGGLREEGVEQARIQAPTRALARRVPRSLARTS